MRYVQTLPVSLLGKSLQVLKNFKQCYSFLKTKKLEDHCSKRNASECEIQGLLISFKSSNIYSMSMFDTYFVI